MKWRGRKELEEENTRKERKKDEINKPEHSAEVSVHRKQ